MNEYPPHLSFSTVEPTRDTHSSVFPLRRRLSESRHELSTYQKRKKLPRYSFFHYQSRALKIHFVLYRILLYRILLYFRLFPFRFYVFWSVTYNSKRRKESESEGRKFIKKNEISKKEKQSGQKKKSSFLFFYRYSTENSEKG